MKKRNVWRNFATASVIAAAVTAAVVPTANAEEATTDYLQTYYESAAFVTDKGVPVTVTYDAAAGKYVGEVPAGTKTVKFNTTLKAGYTSSISNAYTFSFTTSAQSYYTDNLKGTNITISDANKTKLETFRVELTRVAYPETVETSSDLATSTARLLNGRNTAIANGFYIEQEGKLEQVTISPEILEQHNYFIIQPTVPTNTPNIDRIELTAIAKYFQADNPDSAQYTYRVNGEVVDSLKEIPHIGYEYEPGKRGTKIEITVTPSKTAPAGSKPKTYTYIVPKETGTETTLTGFTVSSANNHQFLAAIGEGKLTQRTEEAKLNYTKAVYEYDMVANYNIDHILAKTTADGARTTFVYTVNGQEIRTMEKQEIIPLKVGNNVITVQAVPENGDTTNAPVYTFNVERKENYNIASIQSKEIRISGKLRPTLTTLAGIIEDGIETYTIDLTAEDATKKITIKQNDAVIAEGKGTIKATLDASNIVVEGTKNTSQNPVTITIGDDKDSITYTLDTWKRNPDAPNRTYAVLPAPGQFVNEHAQTVTGSLGSFGWGDGWDTALYSTSANLSAEASGTPGLSLGGFGGFVTYQFDNPVKNDPAHPYGADFIVNGNGFSGNEEPGGIMVAQDKDKDGKPDKDAEGNEIWYELAGSEHYEDTTLWNYSITYKNTAENFTPNFGVNVPWVDSLGRTGEILANGYHSQIYFPMPENYQFEGNAANDMMGDEITFTGTNIQTLKSLFGYADVSPNNKGVTTAQNPYTHKSSGGGFMDIAWAVDQDGKPVQLDEVSFVKIYTNQQTDGGAVGEKSPEILGMLRVNDSAVSDGKTAKPTIQVNGEQVTLGAEDEFTPVVVESLQNIQVDVTSNADNIYINNQKVATRTYEVAPEKGIVRVIVQKGNLQPTIYTMKLIEKAVQHTIDAIAALPETITLAHAEAVEEATKQYEALTEAQQALVSNKEALDLAVATIAQLNEEQAANEAAAKVVEEAIAALPKELTLTDAKTVEAVATKYAALTAAQQALVPNKNVLDEANEAITQLQAQQAANEAAAKAVEEAIVALPKELTLTDAKTVEAVAKQYAALTEAQQALVPNKNVLHEANEAIAQLQAQQAANEAAAKVVEEAIAALPKELALTDAKTVEDVATKYAALTAAQQALVPNKNVLDKATATIAQLQATAEAEQANKAAAKAVEEAIAALPKELTLTDAKAVEEVAKQYEALTAAQQDLVPNKAVLDEANEVIAQLQAQQAANEAAAKAVEDVIAALPDVITLAHVHAVAAAEEAFASLTEAQQALVLNAQQLTKATQTIATLQAEKLANETAAKAVEEAIRALPALITLEAQEAVQQVKVQFELLTEAQQALVSNTEVLQKAQQAIAALQTEAEKQAAIQRENEAIAEGIMAEIAALPDRITLAHATTVQTIVAKIARLTPAQLLLVTNKTDLDEAKVIIAMLQQTKEENEAAAKLVEQAITALPKELTLTDAKTVEEVATKYAALTEAQQALVPNKAVLDKATATIAQLQATAEAEQANKAAAKAVEQAIAALPKELALTDAKAVEEVAKQYAALTEAQQALVLNKAALDKATATIAQLQATAEAEQANKAAAKAVEEAIAALPKELALTDAKAVEEVAKQYAALTAAQQALVPNKNVLDKATATIAQLQATAEAEQANKAAAKAVEEAIAALPKELTLTDAKAVEEVATKYAALTEAQQALVPNKNVLDKATATIAQLQATAEAEQANKAAAKAVEEAIAALPKELTLTDAKAVEEVAKQYAALTEAQQAFVPNKAVLDEATATIERLRKNANSNTNSGGSSYVPSTPVTPPSPPAPTQPEAPEQQPDVTEPETPEQQPEEAAPVINESWEVVEGQTSFTSAQNITLNFPMKAVGTVAKLHVAEDRIELDFLKDDASTILSEYVQVTIPQDVLPTNEGVLVQRLTDGSVVAVPHRVEDGNYVLQLRTAGEVFVQQTNKQFSDIAQDGHKQYIEALANRLIVNGTTADTFSPKATMTRGQFAAMLQRSLALPKTAASTFKDTAGNQFAYELQTLVDIGVLKGDGDLLRPKDHITRKHAALMIARLLEHLQIDVPTVSANDVTFTDKDAITGEALQAVALMQKLNIFRGKEDGRFDPNAPLTRSQMAKVLYQTLTYAKMM